MCNLKFARAFEITEECIRETLDTCAGETMEVYAYFTQHYLTPPACHNDSRTRDQGEICLLYTSPSPRDMYKSRMPSSA